MRNITLQAEIFKAVPSQSGSQYNFILEDSIIPDDVIRSQLNYAGVGAVKMRIIFIFR